MRTRWLKRHPRSRPKTLGQRLGRLAKLVYAYVVRVNDAPRQVAFGVAVGVFLGVFPTFGLAFPLAYGLAWLFRFNKAAALAGAMVMNPLTSPAFWAASAATGTALAGGDWHALYAGIRRERFIFAAGRLTYVYLIGNVVVATAAAAASYGIAYLACRARDRRRAARRGRPGFSA